MRRLESGHHDYVIFPRTVAVESDIQVLKPLVAPLKDQKQTATTKWLYMRYKGSFWEVRDHPSELVTHIPHLRKAFRIRLRGEQAVRRGFRLWVGSSPACVAFATLALYSLQDNAAIWCENFKRGDYPEEPDRGQLLWKVDFDETPGT